MCLVIHICSLCQHDVHNMSTYAQGSWCLASAVIKVKCCVVTDSQVTDRDCSFSLLSGHSSTSSAPADTMIDFLQNCMQPGRLIALWMTICGLSCSWHSPGIGSVGTATLFALTTRLCATCMRCNRAVHACWAALCWLVYKVWHLLSEGSICCLLANPCSMAGVMRRDQVTGSIG